MEGYKVKSSDTQIQISIDRSLVDIDSINNLLERLRVEELVKKAKFTEKVLNVAEEIKKNWWKKNKVKYMEG